jgi:hypothetical protein
MQRPLPPPVGQPFGAPPYAAPAPVSSADVVQRRQRMSWVMAACGAVVVLGALLPWASALDGDASGLDARVGWITLLCGAGLCLYASQGLVANSTGVRHRGWAIAAVSVIIVLGMLAFSVLDDLTSLSGGVVDAGAGLTLTVVAALVAIWPLVVLGRDERAARFTP